jgi:Trk K+ transport system NAD-binding subunit
VLLIGHDDTDVTRRVLLAAGVRVTHLRAPVDREIRRALGEPVDAVVVISRDDHVSLRIALVVEGVVPGVRLIVTVYDHDVAAQLERAAQNVRVMSMPDIVAPTLAGPCLDDRLLSVARTPAGFAGVQVGDGGPQLVALDPPTPSVGKRVLASLGSLLRPFELSARILMGGLLGLLLILVADTAITAIALDQAPVEALYSATKTLVTVGSNRVVDEAPDWFKVFSSVAMLAALGLTAIFTAGVVDRLLDRRLSAIAGPRSVPRRDHVVVVGLGQVGLRLCVLLRELGVPVVGVENDPDVENVVRAKAYGVPVVIGRGGSRFMLRRLSLGRARALAAVTSDEVNNISIVVAALAVRAGLRTLLRAGGGEVINETRSLFTIGVVRDVYRVGGTVLAAAALGFKGNQAFLHEHTVYLISPEGSIEAFEADIGDASGLPPDASAARPAA